MPANTLPPPSGSGKYRRRDAALDRYVEAGGSRTLAGAHAKELRTRAAARQLVSCYPVARALRFIEDLRGRIAGAVEAVTGKRVLRADAADRAEDTAEIRFHVERTPAAREQWIRALCAEAAEDLALARDLQSGQSGDLC